MFFYLFFSSFFSLFFSFFFLFFSFSFSLVCWREEIHFRPYLAINVVGLSAMFCCCALTRADTLGTMYIVMCVVDTSDIYCCVLTRAEICGTVYSCVCCGYEVSFVGVC